MFPIYMEALVLALVFSRRQQYPQMLRDSLSCWDFYFFIFSNWRVEYIVTKRDGF